MFRMSGVGSGASEDAEMMENDMAWHE